MKSKRIYFVSLFAFVAMLLLGSCSPLILQQSSVLNGADLYEYTTFTIIHPRMMSLPKGVKQSDIDKLDAAIAKEMISRGYTESKGRADMVVSVSYQVKLSKEVNVMRARGFAYGSRNVETTRDGIVIMDISGCMDKEHLYYSKLEVDLSSDALFLRDNKLLSKATDKLFKKFPKSK